MPLTRTSIPWVVNPDGTPGFVWNPHTGCKRASRGCFRCYAERTAENPRFKGGFPKGFGLTLRPHKLQDPVKRKKAAGIFGWSMADPFYGIARDYMVQEWAAQAAAPQHHFIDLTKRAGVAKSILSNPDFVEAVRVRAVKLGLHPDVWRWPLENVRLGTSVEDQDAADLRMGDLMAAPNATPVVSVEPLLGPVNLRPWLKDIGESGWVIVGGESGKVNPRDPWTAPDDSPFARPMRLEWVHDVVEQCREAGTPVFVKQFGSVQTKLLGLKEAKGEDWNEWPPELAELKIRQFPAFGAY